MVKKTITEFYIQDATYQFADSKGHSVRVSVDYANNTYTISDERNTLTDAAKKIITIMSKECLHGKLK